MTCPTCQQPTDDVDLFCAECGCDLRPLRKSSAKAQPEPPRREPEPPPRREPEPTPRHEPDPPPRREPDPPPRREPDPPPRREPDPPPRREPDPPPRREPSPPPRKEPDPPPRSEPDPPPVRESDPLPTRPAADPGALDFLVGLVILASLVLGASYPIHLAYRWLFPPAVTPAPRLLLPKPPRPRTDPNKPYLPPAPPLGR